MRIRVNKIRCKRCGEILKSEDPHDFRLCRCGCCGIDGGLEYLRRIGDLELYEELSIVSYEEGEKHVV